MDTAKYWEDVIVLLLSQEYMKLEIQENPGWKTFISEKKNVESAYFFHPMEVIVPS
jgi:hypothetical protein